MSATRIQVVVEEQERAAFRARARAAGLSLSAWLREAGRERLNAELRRTRLRNVAELEQFFSQCDTQDAGGREPDWAAHRQVLEGSKNQGIPDA